VLSVNLPEHPNLRIETDITCNQNIRNQFDPLLLKIIARGTDRENTINLLNSKIKNLDIIGPDTNTRYLEAILAHPDYNRNNITVEFCKDNHKSLVDKYIKRIIPAHLNYLIALSLSKTYLGKENPETSDPWNYVGYWRINDPVITLTIDGELVIVDIGLRDNGKPAFTLNGEKIGFKIISESKSRISIMIGEKIVQLSYIIDNQNNIWISCENHQYKISFPERLKSYPETIVGVNSTPTFEHGEIISPLHGKILEINVEKNQIIKKGDLMMVIEAMKSENRILSPKDAKVKKIAVNVGEQVTDKVPLIFLEDKL
jgi:acetyl/propionyl-CoA carboxylase alpha subunit